MEEEIEVCPGCGCEPDIRHFLVRTPPDGPPKRCGYQCACRAIVIDGMLAGMGD